MAIFFDLRRNLAARTRALWQRQGVLLQGSIVE
jgi:hypothetical protein